MSKQSKKIAKDILKNPNATEAQKEVARRHLEEMGDSNSYSENLAKGILKNPNATEAQKEVARRHLEERGLDSSSNGNSDGKSCLLAGIIVGSTLLGATGLAAYGVSTQIKVQEPIQQPMVDGKDISKTLATSHQNRTSLKNAANFDIELIVPNHLLETNIFTR
ncbi:hypothetical protein SAMN05444392_104175 [Seinonella peptonophila]|uniref:Uncharacterized protein n=1 Tax=Seinonella peptonophila TaxID=112248 RepID=A0A1M4X7M1_9BACL|nr:hypothetical protein [Seinonella peptonophila]SHE89441.1 hypothetical protein SAMN05444392_104175 [Seinonella peptonophila]